MKLNFLIKVNEFMQKYRLTHEEINRLHRDSMQAGVLESTRVSNNGRLNINQFKKIYANKRGIINSLLTKKYAWSTFYFGYLFILTDESGTVLCIIGDRDSMRNAKQRGIEKGVSLNLKDAGTNAVAASIELQRPIFLQGSEHFKHMFYDSSSVCLPINSTKQTEALLSIFVSKEVSARFIIPVLELIVREIERDLQNNGNESAEFRSFENELRQFPLTNRERQIAEYWLLDYDYKQISRVFNISESTVRRHIENIYMKMNVNSKLSLYLKIRGLL